MLRGECQKTYWGTTICDEMEDADQLLAERPLGKLGSTTCPAIFDVI